MESLAWTILLLPLIAAAAIAVFTHRSRALSAMLSVGAVAIGFICSLIIFFSHSGEPVQASIPWISIAGFHSEIGLVLDSLSIMMLLVVTGVGTAIHIYSYGYMQEDPGVSRYFGSLSLFVFSMLGIVLSNNLVQTFIFWELVGVSSYLLIGFWFEKPAAADACKKAFLTNRVGDFGFILGIIMVWSLAGSLNFVELKHIVSENPAVFGVSATAIGLLIFCGAAGKSAQWPLHVWLPDAMEGPTPVSALIHAATMVAAGVYMLCRAIFLLNPVSMTVIAWIGAITALLAALIAVQQNDIKRILAYSTLSQLGYMVMAVGAAAPGAAMFHLTTHAFFKALLFLGAGSVIYGMHHEQNIWKMGALKDKMPTTYKTFLLGTLALSGVPPLSGFYSKDGILAAAMSYNPVLFAIGALVAALTAFYMFRLVFVVFGGDVKSEEANHAHESPGVMINPLRVLAFFAVVGGLIGIHGYVSGSFATHGEDAHHVGWFASITEPFSHAPAAALIGIFAAAIGIASAYQLYGKAHRDPITDNFGFLSWIVSSRFFFDEIYKLLIACTQDLLAKIADWVDRWIVAGLAVRGTHGFVEFTGRTLRLFQTGNIQSYALMLALGLVFVIWLVMGN